ncbi:uncharacterized protein LOC121379670 [Gigantopelta aegis]|uniref:uncharacterized protein LOC121379670 n=1 Tax=Gigantopelta aegis TaxID=1735272 RepID=UPI001B88C710|nr:uncharacterized protein LOC121379670 [Gigantopelta aegis]
MAANILSDAFQNVSNLNMSKERTKEVETSFTSYKLHYAIRLLKIKKAPGWDGVNNEIIRHLGPQARLPLLKLFNRSWLTGKFPIQWQEAIITPVLKKGKEKKRQSKLQTDQPT